MNVAEVASVISSAVVSGGDDGALFDETAGAYKHLRTKTEEMIVELLAGNMREELKAYSRMLDLSVFLPFKCEERSLTNTNKIEHYGPQFTWIEPTPLSRLKSSPLQQH